MEVLPQALLDHLKSGNFAHVQTGVIDG